MDKEKCAHDFAILFLNKLYGIDDETNDELIEAKCEKMLEYYHMAFDSFKKSC